MLPAVVLSAHTMGLGVIRSLGSMGIPVRSIYYEKNDMGYVSRYVSDRRHFCHPERHEKEFIERLMEYSKTCQGALLVPADDATLGIVSKHKHLLKPHYLIACPEWSVTQTFLDKKHTYAIAESIGVPAPRTIRLESAGDLEKIADTLGFPCLIKPCISHQYFENFRKKLVKASNFRELTAAYNEAGRYGLDVMAQEFIPGPDMEGVNYNCYFYDGEPLVEFTAAKVRLSPPVFGIPRVVVSKRIEGVLENGRKILAAIGFSGYACTEFKRDSRDGVYKLMEVNGRHNRSGLLSAACGINFPWIEYMHRVHGHKPAYLSYREGVYWIDEFRDCVHSIKYFGREECSIRGYFLPYFREHVFAVYDPLDPAPFLKRCADLSKMAFRAVADPSGFSPN